MIVCPPSQLPSRPTKVLAMQNPLDWHRGGCQEIKMNYQLITFLSFNAVMVESSKEYPDWYK